jgi:adenosylcobinamide amidohydrolase
LSGGVGSALRRFGGDDSAALACLEWRLGSPLRVASTAPFGGGIGRRDWVLNIQVPKTYARQDTDAHVAEVAQALDLAGPGVGMLTAADVARVSVGEEEPGVRVEATVGLSLPIWAAAPDDARAREEARLPGTINVVAFVPVPHSDAALANLLCTVTEAKAQALADCGVPGTGTASDAVTVLCPCPGTFETAEPFGGPRSMYGAPLARGVYGAIRAGMEAWE